MSLRNRIVLLSLALHWLGSTSAARAAPLIVEAGQILRGKCQNRRESEGFRGFSPHLNCIALRGQTLGKSERHRSTRLFWYEITLSSPIMPLSIALLASVRPRPSDVD